MLQGVWARDVFLPNFPVAPPLVQDTFKLCTVYVLRGVLLPSLPQPRRQVYALLWLPPLAFNPRVAHVLSFLPRGWTLFIALLATVLLVRSGFAAPLLSGTARSIAFLLDVAAPSAPCR